MEPKRIDQTVFGPQGNCQSACLAMLLGLKIEQVPNFALLKTDEIATAAQSQWLHDRGWGIVTIVKWQTLPWPPMNGYYIAGGISPRGNRHAVIYKDRALWHDPHPERGGIASVDDVDLLYPLNIPQTLKSAEQDGVKRLAEHLNKYFNEWAPRMRPASAEAPHDWQWLAEHLRDIALSWIDPRLSPEDLAQIRTHLASLFRQG